MLIGNRRDDASGVIKATTEDTAEVGRSESAVGLGVRGMESPADISGTEVGRVGCMLMGLRRLSDHSAVLRKNCASSTDRAHTT